MIKQIHEICNTIFLLVNLFVLIVVGKLLWQFTNSNIVYKQERKVEITRQEISNPYGIQVEIQPTPAQKDSY